MDLSRLIFLAMIGEALWETSKLFWQQGKVNVDRIGAVVVGILLSILTGLDLFKMVGIPISIPGIGEVIGEVLTGLLLSRGANFIHDIAGSVSSVYSNARSK